MSDNKAFNKESIPQAVERLTVTEKKDVSTETTVEQKTETVIEKVVGIKEENSSSEINNSSSSQSIPVVKTQTPEVKSELRMAVERVMEADLRELYLTMSPLERQIFKKKGEETAREITSLIEKTKINLNKIIKLLFNWLRLIPKVNNFFIEQEAKLKADQLLKLPK